MFDFGMHSQFGYGPFPTLAAWILPLLVWTLVWKGLALWVTAQRRQVGWFVVFLVLNTLGIAEILYLALTNGFKELQKSEK